MGNTDSQHSNLFTSGKSRPSSLKRLSSKEEVLSPYNWWRNTEGAPKTRNSVNQHKNVHPYVSYHYDYVQTQLPDRSPLTRENCRSVPQIRTSPKVLLSGDGSLRVEFTNSRRALDNELCATPVDSTLRDSKGSSISSEESWYDSPWGAATELCDNVFITNQRSHDSSGYTTLSSTRTEDITCPPGPVEFNVEEMLCPAQDTGTSGCASVPAEEDSGIGESLLLPVEHKDLEPSSYSHLFVNPNFTGPFPTVGVQSSQQVQNVSDPHVMHAISREGAQEHQAFSSLTLPCRKTESNSRKDSLKSRICRLSDWTGSLSRKKRRLQEPSETLGSPLDCPTGDSGLQLPAGPHWNLPNGLTHSACSLTEGGQNVYENFMQELEMGEALQVWDEAEGEQAESSSGSLGSLEQMELMFEKEQGVVRRAGRLAFKPLISLQKERKLELVARRRWKQYWVTLKGCMLLLSETDGKSCSDQEMSPRYVLLAEDSIVQAVPEHPKKENVFCLSNTYGDVYLFQASNQTDVENWVTAIHSASASHLAKRQGKEDTVRLLRNQSRSLLQRIDMDGKMKKMAELQLSVITDQRNRKAVEAQIQQWEQNLEKFNLELFRMRCYLASLQGSEQPNPKNLLAAASRQSKTALGRLGIFSVSSFHALMCTRDEATLRRRTRSQCRAVRNKRGIFSSQKGLDSLNRRKRDKRQSLTQVFEEHSSGTLGRPPMQSSSEVYDELEVCPLNILTLSISRPDSTVDFGFAVTGHVDGLGRSHIYVSEVNPESLASTHGLHAGDEILAVNSVNVSTLDLGLIQTFFSHQSLCLLVQREDRLSDEQGGLQIHCPLPSCPPPASDHGAAAMFGSTDTLPFQNVPRESVMPLPEKVCNKFMEHSVSPLYQSYHKEGNLIPETCRNPYSTDPGSVRSSPRHMTITEKLHKVIQELVDTEKSYVKDLGCLFEIYLKPLEKETFLSRGEMESLFGSLPEMLDFQRVFLQTLEEKTCSSPDLQTLQTPEHLKRSLSSLGGSFLYYADHFKLYSGFCANHIKVQKVLERAKTDRAFKQFLDERNLTKQHSSTLESYLIKPVQRVLKYPLLLKELVTLTDPASEEHGHLTEALKAMEKVATHINEMQKIYEDYGTVFDQLVAEQNSTEKEVTEISMGEFIVHSSALWLNPMTSLGRMRKEPELTLFIFKRAAILVYRENSKLKKRMTSSRSADLDPFKFRWLIPATSLQVRPGNSAGSENPCLWELVHTKSELEGRPETIFQLCSRSLEDKVNVMKAIRSLLRDGVKRTTPAQRHNLTFPRRSHQTAARSRSWSKKLQPSPFDFDEARLFVGDTHSEPGIPRNVSVPLTSLTSSLEDQLQRLSFMEDAPHVALGRTCSHMTSLEESRGRGLDPVLVRDYSSQSLNSASNESRFYDTMMGIQKPAIPTL